MNLTNYGIFEEHVHLRAHVCVLVGKVYTYMPTCAIAAIHSGKFKTKVAAPKHAGYQVTANGYVVPPKNIAHCHEFNVKPLIDMEGFAPADNPTVKGQKALNVVVNMVRLGILCPPCQPEIVTDRDIQLVGVDLIIPPGFTMQVKCDYNGGEGPMATGNLYLQIAERNPGFI